MALLNQIMPKELTWTLSMAIFSAVWGMFTFGYNTGVINAPQKVLVAFISDVYQERSGEILSGDRADFLWALTVSIFSVGGMVGGIFAGKIADFFGRKLGLLINNAVAIIGGLLMATCKPLHSIECLILGRFFIGLNCGANCALVPMYLSEIAPTSLRGALGIVNQLGVTLGLFLSQIFGLEYLLGTHDGWPYLLGITIIPAIVQLLTLPLAPESPRYLLLTKKREEDAKKAIKYLRRRDDVDDEIAEIRSEEREKQTEKQYSVKQVIFDKQLRLPLLISIIMQFSQQLSGINAIFYYSTTIFTKAGLTQENAQLATIGVGLIMVVVTIVSIPLIDRAGRRTLMLYGLGGMFVASILFTISLLIQSTNEKFASFSIAFAFTFVIFFAIGPGSIPWLITAELFSQGPRPAAMSVAVLANWLTNFLVGLLYPFQQRHLENFSFLPFTILLTIFWIFTYQKVPETKGRSIEEITRLFDPKNTEKSQINEETLLESCK